MANPQAHPLPSFPLLDLADRREAEHALKAYNQRFIRQFTSPYAIQWPGRPWRTQYRKLADPAIRAHLEGKYWVGCRASWYPWVWILDIDAPPHPFFHETIAETLGLGRDEYLLTTSPSFKEDGSCYMYIRLTYNDRLPTYRLGAAALDWALKRLCEIYPQLKRAIRLPLGRDEHVITAKYQILEKLPWWEGLRLFDDLNPVDIERFPRAPRQGGLPLVEPAAMREAGKRIHPKHRRSEAEGLWLEGLQGPRTRHRAQFLLIVEFWRRNLSPEETKREVLKWVKAKHNGQSRTVNAGRWREIEGEIGAQTAHVYAKMRRYPDGPHNLETGVTRADLKWIAELFRGDVVNQKRLTKLVGYYRPRSCWEWVYIPAWVWREEVAHKDTYKDFIAVLSERGGIESNWSYRHVEGRPDLSYSRKFRLNIPATSEAPLSDDGRNAESYYEAMRILCPTVREMVEFSGVPKQRFYEEMRREEELNPLE